MNNSELRIGNWVIDLDGQETQIASGYDIDGVWKPIPLNEQGLLKIGFCKHETVWLNSYDTETIFRLNDIFYVKSCGSSYGLYSPFKIFYMDMLIKETSSHNDYCIHELQNLVFALTGQEV
jgi:hypothetical protein